MSIKASSWNELKSYISSRLSQGETIWRGHNDKSHNLNSSLYRYFSHHNISKENQEEYEINALNKLKEYLDLTRVIPNLPLGPTKIQLMQILQHYGCPTRLIDWSWSPYIATYFALMNANSTGVLYSINFEKYQKYLENNAPPLDGGYFGLTTDMPDRITMQLIRAKFKLPIPIYPSSYFERPRMQKSIFLLDLFLNPSFDQIFQECGNDILQKIEFPSTILNEAYTEISLMNIDGYHLFSGLEGAVVKSKELLMGLNFNKYHR